MIKSGRPPRDKSERMIFNNYLAMNFVRDHRQDKLTPALICELHRIVTEGTLNDPKAAGRLQTPEEDRVKVWGPEGNLFHTPPPAEQLPERLNALCAFANRRKHEAFVHPVVKAIIIHFWLAYDHPFADGNGRTARALFYWYMLKRQYWLTQFLTISAILRKAQAKYARSFLYTETDDNDLTYFILYHLSVILGAIEELYRYLQRKAEEVREIEALLKYSAGFNHRQIALLGHALRNPAAEYTFKSHGVSHNVVHQTARTDLLRLEERDLLIRRKVGKAYVFSPPSDLLGKLRNLNTAD
jgi:Fic family protein